MATTSTTPISGRQVGRSLPRLEAREKVTGRAEYTHNLRLPGMLFGRIFRSTVAHGRIRSIDASAAAAVPGVYRVVTSDDVRKVIPHPYYGPAFHDQPILAIDKVHYVGEPVAVVLARDPHVAEQAAALIVADYDELPAVFDEVEALTSKVYVHDELKPAGAFADLKHLKGARNTNTALTYRLRRGDFDASRLQRIAVELDPIAFASTLSNPADPNILINDSLDILLRVPISDTSKQTIKTQILLSNQAQDYYWSNAWNAYLANPADPASLQVVFNRLQTLYKYFMDLAEYQLS